MQPFQRGPVLLMYQHPNAMRFIPISLLALFILTAFNSVAQDCDQPAVIAFETGMWGSEVSWSLVDETGTLIASGGGYPDGETQTEVVCLGEGCHVLEMFDSFGDGWNGAQWTLVEFSGQVWGPFTIDSGSSSTVDVSVNGGCGVDVAGCTDPTALNFNPYALVDDGSCVQLEDCSGCENEVADPVCAWNPTSNEITWYPGPCWALCDGAFVLDEWDCTSDTGGCTDAAAVNFDPNATYDDGSCISPCDEGSVPATFYLCTFNNGNEVAIDIVHESGSVLYAQDGFNNGAIIYEDLCLETGCYTATLTNSAGNFGWNNGYFSILGATVAAYNITLSDDATSATFLFSVDGACESVPGCTDPEAPNFTPEADWNDGSCLPSCDCEDAEDEPVCVWDWTTGGYVTLNNLCEAECWGLNIAWIGDCNTQPIAGCTDPEALNYNPEATVNQSCVYAPACASDQIQVTLELASTDPTAEYPPYFYVTNPLGGDYPNVVSYTSDGVAMGIGCLAPGCYNFFLYETWSGDGATATATAAGDTTVFTLEAGAYSATFGWGVGTDEPCVYEIGGCTDAEALNYNPTATFDDGSCNYPLVCDNGIPSTLYVCTFSNGQAVGLNITASDGSVLYDQQGYSDMAIVYVDVCLDPEMCYTVTMTNNDGGYGWNGGYWWLDAEGFQIGGGELPYSATEATDVFGWFGACEEGNAGCTDPAASNFNPLATIDDGSCVYPSACPIGQEVDFAILALTDAWFEITNDAGEIMTEGVLQGGAWSASACLIDGCYDFRLESFGGASLSGSFASMTLEDGTMLSMVAEDSSVMEEGFGLGAECGDSGFDGYGGSPWEFDETIAFTPYPNPTENVINIAGNGWDQHFPIDVTVRDLTGKVVHQSRIGEGLQPRLSTQEWPAGMYLIQVNQGQRSGNAPFMIVR